MSQSQKEEESMLGAAENRTDANRLYSILLDTRESTVSDTMYDISEKIMKNEKENAKIALEQLWSLKKNLSTKTEDEYQTVDLLINYYQDKLDVLRNKEEHIKKISRDSRDLLEEKRQRDAEIASVKQELSDCSLEIERLNKKQKELKVKEQELLLTESQVMKELKLNTNEVVNGLYEIILSSQEEHINEISLDQDKKNNLKIENEKKTNNHLSDNPGINKSNIIEEIVIPFPKSVVKTTRGVVIGEYYYDTKADKSKRQYIYNSNFLRKYLLTTIKKLAKNFEPTIYGEAYQMIQDALKRIVENKTLHFEVSTNEILNKETLCELKRKIEQRNYNAVVVFCNKLQAKIEALGTNYVIMLEEQMARYSNK
ncbi:MAG: hypothetical protein PVI26_04470 [Chitinispirillia bacterium]|jgi:hypothetical protein